MKLTKDDWIEIYAALESKERLIERGDYGEGDHPSDNDKWRAHLNLIIEKIGGDGSKMWNTIAIQAVHETTTQERYECGGCGAYHPVGFEGDCRDDSNRFPTP